MAGSKKLSEFYNTTANIHSRSLAFRKYLKEKYNANGKDLLFSVATVIASIIDDLLIDSSPGKVYIWRRKRE